MPQQENLQDKNCGLLLKDGNNFSNMFDPLLEIKKPSLT
jgi:hypothetical protein